MRKKDLTIPALLLEAVDIVLLFIYITDILHNRF